MRISAYSALLLCAIAPLFSGCNPVANLIDRATIQLSPNLETVNVTLLFKSNVQSNYSGALTIGNYGELFMDPYTPTTPLALGFALNTSILNDQNIAHITPTSVLPNGMPIPLTFPVVQLSSVTPISPKFNLYAYVDVTHFSWLGVAAMFTIADKYFPEGLSVSQTLLNDSQGNEEITANAFGPIPNPDGTIKQSGGVALFANVRELIQRGTLTPEHPITIDLK